MLPQAPDWQGMQDRRDRAAARQAFKTGSTVPFSLGRLMDLKLSLKVIRAIYRNPS